MDENRICNKTIKDCIFIPCLLLTIILFFESNQAIGEINYSEKIKGIWMLDDANTMKLRIIEGIPWHIGSRFGNSKFQVVMKFTETTYQLYNEKAGYLADTGKYNVYKIDNNKVTIRFYPEDNRFGVNAYEFDELIDFAIYPGDKIPYIVGFKFNDKNSIETFSFVKGFEKDQMIQKNDNACWKRINETELQSLLKKIKVKK